MAMLVAHIPSATFDERLIQRSGSGETDISSNNSGLATPEDEDIQPLVTPVKQAERAMAVAIDKQSLVGGRKEYQLLHTDAPVLDMNLEESPVARAAPAAISRILSSELGSSVPQSPEFEDPVVTHARAKAMYNLPNRHISIEMPRDNKDERQIEVEGFCDTLEEMGFESLCNRNWTAGSACKCMLRAVLFIPWCVVVGGSIALCPKKLDAITFRAGYLEPVSGIHRFAHWADRGVDYLTIFAGFLALLVWLRPIVGISVACGAAALCVNAWHDFRLDPTIPLGEDDQQSIYLSVTKFWLSDEFLNLRKTTSGYYVMKGEPQDRILSDSASESMEVD